MLIVLRLLLQKKWKIFILIVNLSLFLLGGQETFASRADDLYKKAADDFHSLYEATSFRKQESNWLKTIKKFEYIYSRYPRHRKASDSLYNIGKLYQSLYKWNAKIIFIDLSNQGLRKLVDQYPKSVLTDDAQYMLAQNFELYKREKHFAYREYRKLIKFFPESEYVNIAHEKIKKLDLNLPIDLKNEPVDTQAEGYLKSELIKLKFGGLPENKVNKSKLTQVRNVKYWSTSEWSRVVIETSEAIRFQYKTLKKDPKKKKGRRFYIDLKQTYLPKSFKSQIRSDDEFVKRIRIAQNTPDTTRIVLDLPSIRRIKVVYFEQSKKNKIFIDLFGKNGPNQQSNVEINTQKQIDTNIEICAECFGLKIKRIILDPGHGGRDPGATAYGIQEKTIALHLARQVKKILEKKLGVQVLLTRKRDKYISLEARTAFANKKKGDLFVSLHLNASEDNKARGIETYILQLTNDKHALSVAAKENQVSERGMSDLQKIIYDLLTDVKVNESYDLASSMQRSLIKRLRKSRTVRDLGVKKGPFLVLYGANMPSILVETGFITHPQEGKLFKSKKYLRELSEGIYHGIKKYKNQIENPVIASN